MEKTLSWIFGILAFLAIGGTVVFAILWNKEKKKNQPAKKLTPAAADAAARGIAGYTCIQKDNNGNCIKWKDSQGNTYER